MSTLKSYMASAATSASLLLVPAMPVAADSTNTDSFNNTTTNTVTTTLSVDKSITIGDCVVMMDDIKVWLDQYNGQSSYNKNLDMTLGQQENDVDDNDDHNAADQSNSNSSTQGNSSNQSQNNGSTITITVAPNCSVTNVQPAVAAGGAGGGPANGGAGGGSVLGASTGGQGAGAQVQAPAGGVGAGYGAQGVNLGAAAGLFSSLGLAGFSLRRLSQIKE